MAETGVKRVAAYCRVSTDQGEQADSFESQQRYFRQYIARRQDWQLCGVFADEGVSGTGTRKRREFNRMMDCARRGEIDLIVTKEISRFARNTLDSIYFTRELKKYGVGVIFMNDGINTLDGDSELRLAIMASIAQEESRRTSERVKWGQRRRMEQGVVFGRSMLGYDVRDGKMTVNEQGAETVRLIFRKFAEEGKGTHVIARELTEEGVPSLRGSRWSATVVLRVLRNEKYCGDLVQKKTCTPDYLTHEKRCNRGLEELVIIRDHHEPIVTREVFDAANRLLDSRSESQTGKEKYSSRYPFSGKIRCGRCGSGYAARYKKRKDGSIYKAWRCSNGARYGAPHMVSGERVGCTGESIRSEDVLRIMELVFRGIDFDRKGIAAQLMRVTGSVLSGNFRETSAVQREIDELKRRRTAVIELYAAGSIDMEEFTALRSKYDGEMAELKKASDCGPVRLAEAIKAAVVSLLSGEPDEELYGGILDRMTVNDRGHIDVRLKGIGGGWTFTAAGKGE